MKLKLFIAIAAIAIFTACETPYRATDTTVVGVPEETQRAFAQQYPNSINVAWSNYDPNVTVLNDWELSEWPTMDATDYVVRFDMDNENYYAWYDSDGTWIGTAYVVKDYTTLPQAVHTSLGNTFPAYTITSVNKEFKKDRIAYEIVMKREENKVVLIVDSEGNILKQKTKTP